MSDISTLENILSGIQPLNDTWVDRARKRTAQLLMPTRALGRLHDISEKICGMQETITPDVTQKAILVMAGDHGVVAEGVSAYPQEVTGAMVETFLAGGAGINVLARYAGADVWVVDAGIITDLSPKQLENPDRLITHKMGPGTQNLSVGPARSREQATRSILVGFDVAKQVIESGADMLGTGDMGIGNTTPSAAIGAVITGAELDVMVGRGTGVDDAGLKRKRKAIRRGIELNKPDPKDGLDVLAKVGGFEIGAIAGCILAGAYYRKPVVVDGFISAAGALIAHSMGPCSVDFMFAGHASAEPGHQSMMKHLGLDPILNLGMRLGEGTGGAMAMMIIESAVRIFLDMATFEEAGVPGKNGSD